MQRGAPNAGGGFGAHTPSVQPAPSAAGGEQAEALVPKLGGERLGAPPCAAQEPPLAVTGFREIEFIVIPSCTHVLSAGYLYWIAPESHNGPE
jgi:hypothetical protein